MRRPAERSRRTTAQLASEGPWGTSLSLTHQPRYVGGVTHRVFDQRGDPDQTRPLPAGQAVGVGEQGGLAGAPGSLEFAGTVNRFDQVGRVIWLDAQLHDGAIAARSPRRR
jgi:hypothetical protein